RSPDRQVTSAAAWRRQRKLPTGRARQAATGRCQRCALARIAKQRQERAVIGTSDRGVKRSRVRTGLGVTADRAFREGAMIAVERRDRGPIEAAEVVTYATMRGRVATITRG